MKILGIHSTISAMAHGVVGYNLACKINTEIENGVYIIRMIGYNTISDVIKNVSE